MKNRVPITTTLDEGLLKESKSISALEGIRLNDFIEEAMREKLLKRAKNHS